MAAASVISGVKGSPFADPRQERAAAALRCAARLVALAIARAKSEGALRRGRHGSLHGRSFATRRLSGRRSGIAGRRYVRLENQRRLQSIAAGRLGTTRRTGPARSLLRNLRICWIPAERTSNAAGKRSGIGKARNAHVFRYLPIGRSPLCRRSGCGGRPTGRLSWRSVRSGRRTGRWPLSASSGCRSRRPRCGPTSACARTAT